MEDALVHLEKVVKKFGKGSLNPCFNGRCTRTDATVFSALKVSES